MTVMNDDVLIRKWGNVIKRLESVARTQFAGYGIITMSIMIGPDGDPKFWTEPAHVKFEPKGARVSDILREFAGHPTVYLTDDGDNTA